MTRDRFVSLRFKGFMELEYVRKRDMYGYEYLPVMLLAVDWDNDIVKVIPFPESWAEEKEFWTSIEHVELPSKRMKVVKQ